MPSHAYAEVCSKLMSMSPKLITIPQIQHNTYIVSIYNVNIFTCMHVNWTIGLVLYHTLHFVLKRSAFLLLNNMLKSRNACV